MAITCAFDLETRQYDITNAFANATRKQPIACACAEGFERPGKILWVLKALYGLKTSPLDWFKELTYTLDDLGLHPVPDTNCLFMNDWLILIFFVDDIMAIYSSRDELKMNEFESKLIAKYELRQLGAAEHFLGIRIVRDRANRKL